MRGKVLLRICSTKVVEYLSLPVPNTLRYVSMMIDGPLTHSRTQERTRQRSHRTSDAKESGTHTERRVEGSSRAAAAETRAPSSKQTTTRGTRGASSPSRCLCSSSCLSFSISSTWCLVLEIATHLCSCHLILHQTRERRSLSDTRASRLSRSLRGSGRRGRARHWCMSGSLCFFA